MWYTVNSNKIKAKRKTTMKKINKKNLLINGAISVGVAAAGVVAVLPKNNAQAEKSIDQLDKEIKAIQSQISDAESQASQLRNKAQTLQNELNGIENEKTMIQSQISIYQKQFEKLQIEIKNNEDSIQRNRNALGSILATMSLDDDITPIERIAGSSNLSKALDNFEYQSAVKNQLVEKVDSIKRAKAELEKQRDETKVALTNQKQAESALQEKIRQQNDLIAKTKNDEAEYTKYASERSSQKAELQKQQQDMIQAQILRAARAAGGGAIPQAIAGTSSYPWNDANCYVDGNAVSHGGADGNGGDGYGYGCRQCVSYVAWKLRATKGINAAYWGNAKNVPASARNAGFRTGSTPKVGSFGVMTGGQYGHIVWVESVNGNMVTISQYNYLVNGRWGQFSTMTVPASTYDTYVYFD